MAFDVFGMIAISCWTAHFNKTCAGDFLWLSAIFDIDWFSVKDYSCLAIPNSKYEFAPREEYEVMWILLALQNLISFFWVK